MSWWQELGFYLMLMAAWFINGIIFHAELLPRIRLWWGLRKLGATPIRHLGTEYGKLTLYRRFTKSRSKELN